MHVHFLVLQLAIKCKCHNKVGLDQDRTDLKVVSAQSLTLGVRYLVYMSHMSHMGTLRYFRFCHIFSFAENAPFEFGIICQLLLPSHSS